MINILDALLNQALAAEGGNNSKCLPKDNEKVKALQERRQKVLEEIKRLNEEMNFLKKQFNNSDYPNNYT